MVSQSPIKNRNSTDLDESIFLKDVFNIISGGVSYTLDISCQKIHHNKIAANFLRISAGESLSLSAPIIPPLKIYRNGKELIPEEMPIQRSVWQGERVIGEVLDFIWSDGVKRTAIWNSSPLRSKASGLIIGAIATNEDISYRIQLEEELKGHREHLEELINRRTIQLQASNDTLQREMALRLSYEKELARLERFNILGQMAAGIAHEVRNPMTTVRGFLQLLGSRQEYAKDKLSFDLMIEELDRSNEIMTEFLSLAKTKTSSEFDFVKIDINFLISKLYPLLMADAISLNQNLIFEEGQTEELWLNPKEINQLVINIVRNGFEANSPNKCLIIKTYLQDNFVILSIKDEGPGIDSEILKTLGAPFITTKDTGTGLGLSVCYSIAARHNATIEVETGSLGTNIIIRFKKRNLALIESWVNNLI